jgi:Cdc6-like AAA superfamily ATPase
VKPKHFGEVRADISQAGKHLLIEGPSGIGKTCVVFKVFEELHWNQGRDFTYVGCRDQNAEQTIDVFLQKAAAGDAPSPRVLVIGDLTVIALTSLLASGVSI